MASKCIENKLLIVILVPFSINIVLSLKLLETNIILCGSLLTFKLYLRHLQLSLYHLKTNVYEKIANIFPIFPAFQVV